MFYSRLKILFILNEDWFLIFNGKIEYDFRERVEKMDIFRVWE